jgi:hypothetical protein
MDEGHKSSVIKVIEAGRLGRLPGQDDRANDSLGVLRSPGLGRRTRNAHKQPIKLRASALLRP